MASTPFKDILPPVYLLAAALSLFTRTATAQPEELAVHFEQIDSLHQIEVYVGRHFFTAYRYDTAELKKPVLFPLYTSTGVAVTRGYPLATRPGERIDHPHHYGLWFNHGDVNGFDFWNNSDAIPADQRHRYGTILHRRVVDMHDGTPGSLTVEKDWVVPSGDTLLLEQTTYTFTASAHLRKIGHQTTLTATGQDVVFRDSKEGMFALRVARQLEHPSEEPVLLTDASLQPATDKQVNNEGVTGHYRNSEGVEGIDVWGRRARWISLSGILNGDSVAVALFDHPGNPNHPPHWMARGYGLFGVNPFGSTIYSEGQEILNFTLKAGQSVSFRHEVLIFDGTVPEAAYLEKRYNVFAKTGEP